jgi:hypothetical protein
VVQFYYREVKKWWGKLALPGMGGGGGGVRWPRYTEVAMFGGSVLVPGRAGSSSGGPTLLISVRWTRESVVRVVKTAYTGRRDGPNHVDFLNFFFFFF